MRVVDHVVLVSDLDQPLAKASGVLEPGRLIANRRQAKDVRSLEHARVTKRAKGLGNFDHDLRGAEFTDQRRLAAHQDLHGWSGGRPGGCRPFVHVECGQGRVAPREGGDCRPRPLR